MKTSQLVLTIGLLLSQSLFAAESVEKRLFTLEKSFNSENILVIHTQVDNECKFVSNKNGYIDFYWLMDKTTKKNVHEAIRGKVSERVKFLGINSTRNNFKISLNDLSEIKHDLEDNTIEVSAELLNGACEVKSVMKLGASASYKNLDLKKTYCNVATNMIGIPKGCTFLELQGVDVNNTESFKVKFKGK
jgi:hypothetical protein